MNSRIQNKPKKTDFTKQEIPFIVKHKEKEHYVLVTRACLNDSDSLCGIVISSDVPGCAAELIDI